MSALQTGLITVAEFLRLPEPPEGHNELHHGELVSSATHMGTYAKPIDTR